MIAMFMKWNVKRLTAKKWLMILFVKVILCSLLEKKD